jgi:hypothetical protein
MRPFHHADRSMRFPATIRRTAALSAIAVLVSACGRTEEAGDRTVEESSPVETADAVLAPLEVTDDEIRAADGTVLLRMANVPSQIPVDDEISFGAAGRFVEASLAPDEQWLAAVTSGAAHSGGWLVRVGADEPRPAAFQYGGSLSLGPWSEDGRWIVFVEDGPAGGRTLSVADRSAAGATVEQSSRPVRLPDGVEMAPDQPEVEVVGWRDGRLVFEVEGERFRYDPRAGSSEAAAT